MNTKIQKTQFQIKMIPGLEEVYDHFKVTQPPGKFKAPVSRTASFVQAIIRLHAVVKTNEDSADQTRFDVADLLFKKESLKSGQQGYIKMLNELVKTPAGKKHGKRLMSLAKWFKYLSEDRLLDLKIDELRIISSTYQDKKLIEELIKKYDQLSLYEL